MTNVLENHSISALFKVRYAVVFIALIASLSWGCASSMPKTVETWRATMAETTTPDGQTLRYIDVGPRDGKVIFLLHGLPTSSYLYHQVIPLLTKGGYRVVAPDLIGYGASSKPEDAKEYAVSSQGDRLIALLAELHVEHVSIVVHDIGGLVGWDILSKQPSLISRILVLNTTAYTGFKPPVEMRILAGPIGGIMSGMMSGDMMGRSLMGDFIRDNTGDEGHVDRGMIDSVWWSMREGTNIPMRAMAQSFLSVTKVFPKYQKALRNFQGPSSLLWGGKDKVLKFTTIAQLFASDLRIPPERMHVLENAGHFLMIDDPQKMSTTILELMSIPLDPGVKVVATASEDGPNVDLGFSGPPPGPSVSAAFDIADRVSLDPTEHDVRGGTRMRLLLGGLPGYALGFDANVGYAGGDTAGLTYRAAAYPIGIGYAGRGSQLSLSVGVGVHDINNSGTRFEAPISLDIAWQLGPVRALTWGHVAWTPDGFDELVWEGAAGLRLGRTSQYFPKALRGSGPYLAAIASGQGEFRKYGLALGFELGDGR